MREGDWVLIFEAIGKICDIIVMYFYLYDKITNFCHIKL